MNKVRMLCGDLPQQHSRPTPGTCLEHMWRAKQQLQPQDADAPDIVRPHALGLQGGKHKLCYSNDTRPSRQLMSQLCGGQPQSAGTREEGHVSTLETLT